MTSRDDDVSRFQTKNRTEAALREIASDVIRKACAEMYRRGKDGDDHWLIPSYLWTLVNDLCARAAAAGIPAEVTEA